MFTSAPCYSLQQIKEIAKKAPSHQFLIDVRRPDEVESTGLIPNSHHIPMAELEEAFKMEPSAFQSKYGFEKPSEDDTLIFSCQAGVRASKAAGAVGKMGYPKCCYYGGSWGEWSCHNK